MKIINTPSATLEQCKEWIKGVKTAHPLASAMIPLLWDAAIDNGIDPCVLIAQAMKETGYFNFKGVIRPNFCNTCGLKITKGGGDLEPGAHMRFDYWEDGIMAHSDHLALYAGSSNTPKYSPECASHQNEKYKENGITKDPRHFTYLHGKCKNVEDLSGNWAPGKDYGQEIVRIANQIINTKVTEHECSEDTKYKELYEKAKRDIESIHHSFIDVKSKNEQLMDELKAKTEELEILKIKYNNIKELYDTAKQIVDSVNKFNELVNGISEYNI